METDDGYIWGEQGIAYRLVQSLSSIPTINITLYVNCTSIQKRNNKEQRTNKIFQLKK